MYKRQSNAGASSIIEPKRLGFGAGEDEKQDHERMKNSVMAVSYTHLDVYKRQMPQRLLLRDRVWLKDIQTRIRLLYLKYLYKMCIRDRNCR